MGDNGGHGRINRVIDAPKILSQHAVAIDAHLRDALSQLTDAPPKLIEAMQYSLFAGGKRLRPALVLESCAATGGDASQAMSAAGAVELIHTFSLVHDDLPAMDDDDLRRGRPTSHKVFGEAIAILTGDAMVALAFQMIADAPRLVLELARATGACGMIGGQVRDIESENRQLDLGQLQSLHRMKTAALITASCTMGAMCANMEDGADDRAIAALREFGEHIGLAFQIADDLLDETATARDLGKQTQKDAARGKSTYPILLGHDRAKHAADCELSKAITALSPLGARAENLATLARFVVERKH